MTGIHQVSEKSPQELMFLKPPKTLAANLSLQCALTFAPHFSAVSVHRSAAITRCFTFLLVLLSSLLSLISSALVLNETSGCSRYGTRNASSGLVLEG